MLGIFTLLGSFAVATPASALTCNSVTITGTVFTGTPPARAQFKYDTSYNTVANGGGTPTPMQYFTTEGTFPIEQYISGLSESTTYYYRLIVTNDYGTEALNIRSLTMPACQQATPTVSLTANPTSITSGQSSVLNWSSANATSCSTSWGGSNSTSGSQTVYPTYTTNYSVTCTNSTGQSANASATVYVNQINNICQDVNAINYGGTLPCRYQSAQPTVFLYSNPTSITSGQSSVLNWSSANATSCSTSWGGSNSTSGSQTVYPTYTTNYSVTCTNSTGQSANASATVYVNQINNICQDVNAINYGGTLPCRYNTVNNLPTVVLYADQASVPYNGAATIRWITTNATSCYASGGSNGWVGTRSIGPGSFYTGSLTGSRTYNITCSNAFGSDTDSVTINVRGASNTNPVIPTSLVLINSSIDRNQPIVPTIDNTRPRPGDEINYTVNYQNIGTASITGLTLRMNLPYEVDYMFSTPSNPIISGNTLVFNLGTLRANGQGTVTVRVRVRENIPAGTNLNFPATLSYIDPSGQVQSVNANVSAQVWSDPANDKISLGANVFWAGFLPTNLFGWLLLLILILVLVLIAKYLFGQPGQPFSKKTTTTTIK